IWHVNRPNSMILLFSSDILSPNLLIRCLNATPNILASFSFSKHTTKSPNKKERLLPPPLLRTVRETFASYRSSLL
ncbi:MAG TPA: hypothetical protein VER35_02155, partial [Candidatus Limnocylindrales bacterium]|nr:hypothetical protein [Candidatus Limnocylindrales bacterium]